MNPLKNFLEPKSIAIVGISQSPGSLSMLALENLLNAGFEGKIYPVNPKGGEIHAHRVFTNLMEIDDDIDLALFYLPPMAIPEATRICGQKGVHSVIIVSDGLEATMANGKTIEQNMMEIARQWGIRILGPDSMGVVSAESKFTTGFVPLGPLQEGGFSLICQTGVLIGAGLAWLISSQRVGISKSIDLAKKCDINEVDCLEYLLEDPYTRAIGLHIEQVADGKRFLEVARRTSLKKPVLVLKAGKSEVGARAISSHTGSLAGNDEIYTAAFSQCGLIRVQDIDELADLAKAFLHLPPMKGKNLGIVTYSGGWGALASDLCEEFGLSVSNLSEETLQNIREVTPSWRKITNPVDIWPPTKLDTSETYRGAIRAVAEDDGVDAILVLAPAIITPKFDVLDGILEEVKRWREKPIVTWAVGDMAGMEKTLSLTEHHCLVFPSVKRAIRVLSANYFYYNKRLNSTPTYK